MAKRQITLIVHNVRSAHNVGSMLRTADGLGIDKVYLTGYTPYPAAKNDSRLPHLEKRIDSQIHKTALGAESSVDWEHDDDILKVINKLKQTDFHVTALEQSEKSIALDKFKPPARIALIVGREVEGIEPEVLGVADQILEIPMKGKKESFNVAIAAAIGLYGLKEK